jgi:hypothetical protein
VCKYIHSMNARVEWREDDIYDDDDDDDARDNLFRGLVSFFICLLHWCVFFYKYVVLYTPGRMFLL